MQAKTLKFLLFFVSGFTFKTSAQVVLSDTTTTNISHSRFVVYNKTSLLAISHSYPEIYFSLVRKPMQLRLFDSTLTLKKSQDLYLKRFWFPTVFFSESKDEMYVLLQPHRRNREQPSGTCKLLCFDKNLNCTSITKFQIQGSAPHISHIARKKSGHIMLFGSFRVSSKYFFLDLNTQTKKLKMKVIGRINFTNIKHFTTDNRTLIFNSRTPEYYFEPNDSAQLAVYTNDGELLKRLWVTVPEEYEMDRFEVEHVSKSNYIFYGLCENYSNTKHKALFMIQYTAGKIQRTTITHMSMIDKDACHNFEKLGLWPEKESQRQALIQSRQRHLGVSTSLTQFTTPKLKVTPGGFYMTAMLHSDENEGMVLLKYDSLLRLRGSTTVPVIDRYTANTKIYGDNSIGWDRERCMLGFTFEGSLSGAFIHKNGNVSGFAYKNNFLENSNGHSWVYVMHWYNNNVLLYQNTPYDRNRTDRNQTYILKKLRINSTGG